MTSHAQVLPSNTKTQPYIDPFIFFFRGSTRTRHFYFYFLLNMPKLSTTNYPLHHQLPHPLHQPPTRTRHHTRNRHERCQPGTCKLPSIGPTPSGHGQSPCPTTPRPTPSRSTGSPSPDVHNCTQVRPPGPDRCSVYRDRPLSDPPKTPVPGCLSLALLQKPRSGVVIFLGNRRPGTGDRGPAGDRVFVFSENTKCHHGRI
jgi:hypothetical protein